MNKTKQKKRTHLAFRVNVLFFVIFLLFSGLILRLGIVQIVQGEDFVNELESTTNSIYKFSAPRGIMYDRFGNVVVDNQVELSLTFTNPSRNLKTNEIVNIARELEPMLEMDTSRVTDRDKREYLLLQMDEKSRYDLVSKKERKDIETMAEEYQLEISRIPEDLVESLTIEDQQIIAIYRKMQQGHSNIPQRIKRNITEQEAHMISENLDHLPGIDILRDSTRTYLYGDSFRSFFGSTNSIPKEKVDYYVSRGYDRSDLVGISFLEAQYEAVLRGEKAVIERITNKTFEGPVHRQTNEKLGKRGNDLVLTLDMELQQRLESILDSEMKKTGNQAFLQDRSAYVVLMDPRTGDILAMAGYLDSASVDDEDYADHIGNVTKAFAMGSTVKAASVLTGFQTGIIQPGDRFHDEPIHLPATPVKKSWTNQLGVVNDIVALEQSSNVYMFQIGMRMAKCYYKGANQHCGWNSESIREAYSVVRSSFSQFGLGSETGIDLPYYETGLKGGSEVGGNIMDLMIGQYDTYTPLQLAQYISTIANDGYRVQPRLVREIREPSIRDNEPSIVVQSFEPEILNRIDMSEDHIKRVQEGLRGVMTRGTAAKKFADASYQPAGKTGTAQVRVAVGNGENRHFIEGNTQTLVGYAPYNDPEIAFAVVVPFVKLDDEGGRKGLAQDIADEALKVYFKLKKGRKGPILVE
ncbi:peptidoglycan D,D-transpeptidase FtsI family protein [Halalkalibacter alkalisediminis]|uniref:serine-type D-Ala-D-Ala carboxypeptidase n=1 Tax=Halalkalibacter alkalisediminis TaxID=935616 RepID=A0ABV6NKU1_9BACI|nr:penicillin-binding protein 2 [Halalkalibacter alkalisediminis]